MSLSRQIGRETLAAFSVLALGLVEVVRTGLAAIGRGPAGM